MIKTVSHIIFSVLLFMLTIGVTVSKHYSNGKLYSQSVFGEAESCDKSENEVCEMQTMSSSCETHKKNEQKNMLHTSCSCEDTAEYIRFNADYTIPENLSINNISGKEITIISHFLYINFNNFFFNPNIQNTNINNSLLKIPDFTSFLQVFRC